MFFLKKVIKQLIPRFVISWYHFKLAFLGALFYGFPSKRIKVIGVTGTKGKSTVVHLISKILEGAGFKVSSISSIRFKIGDKEWPNDLKMTMPGRLVVQKMLRDAVNQGCQYFILEVTSEGIKQFRHKFINFDISVFTNLAPEHIESHGGFEKYKRAKGELFRTLKNKPGAISVINLNDKNADYFLKFSIDECYGYGIKSRACPELTCLAEASGEAQVEWVKSPAYVKTSADKQESRIKGLEIIEAENVLLRPTGSQFIIHDSKFMIRLMGEFNIYNALAAICVGLSQKISLEKMAGILKNFKGMPGRMEIVIDKPFAVIVDYAHTPDSLEQVYRAINNLKSQGGKIIGVLGSAGGGRDKWKRSEMGKIAAQYCDYIILTNEDPYDENPNSILREIELGFSQVSSFKFQVPRYEKILDRREAINKALSLAQLGDIVIVTGKGCEPWMCVAGGEKIPWDDREIVREEFKKLF